MKIEMNVHKSYLFLILLGIFIIAGLITVYAYNSSPANPAVFGNSLNEIDGFPICVTGEALIHNSSGWGCTNVISTTHFGGWEARRNNTLYIASTDGFVTATANVTKTSDWDCTIKIESLLGTVRQVSDPNGDSLQVELMSPVRKGDSWAVNSNCGNKPAIYWIPLTT